jgi:hypothetical protein
MLANPADQPLDRGQHREIPRVRGEARAKSPANHSPYEKEAVFLEALVRGLIEN